jgi:hypothetical protein
LNVGWNGGHTAATLPDGTPVSSGEGGVGVRVGGGGAFQKQFTHHMYLPMESEGEMNDAPPPFDPMAAPPLDPMAAPPPPPAGPGDLPIVEDAGNLQPLPPPEELPPPPPPFGA